MVNNLENDKSSKPKTIRLQIIDNCHQGGFPILTCALKWIMLKD